MKVIKPLRILTLGLCLTGSYAWAQTPGAAVEAHLPGELSAEDVLNGVYPFGPSPKVEFHDQSEGLAADRLGKIPAPGVHPRILISPDQLPDLRRRLKETENGRDLWATMNLRVDAALGKPGTWGAEFYSLLAAGNQPAVEAALLKNKGLPGGFGHYQPYLTAMTLEAFRCLINEDKAGGERAAAALTTYSKLVMQVLEQVDKSPLNDDVWRARNTQPATGKWYDGQGGRDIVGYHLLGYAYDFTAPFMTEGQRAVTRKAISKATQGKLWMGARLPHHFRDWNWVAIGLQSPLMALAIEGEEGYDPRVYKLGVEIARDYLTYGISASGSSTEAVGYTGFGLYWCNPFVVAATRRGDMLLTNSHHRAMIDWYVQSLDPQGGKWTSHGDGGDSGPGPGTLLMWRYFFPNDAEIDFLWQEYVKGSKGKPFGGAPHMIEALLYATDGIKDAANKPIDYASGAKLNLPLSWFDPIRSSLITRNAWTPDAAKVEFESRTDSFCASHEHADRGNFTLAALGRDWAKENFRSIETRHHNNILVDGMGQGFWPGPGKWLGLKENKWATIAACDAKESYDWLWPKELETEKPDFVRFKYARWSDYPKLAAATAKRFEGLKAERDPRPTVAEQWQGFEKTGPRMWDEDSWPVRYPHNPVERAFRTIAFIRDAKPYLLVVDDIQKDDKERLYEWLMQTGTNTAMATSRDSDILLCDATVKRDSNGIAAPQKGERQLLVRILDLKDPALDRDFQSRPSVRLETFDRKDTLVREVQGLSGARSFGLDMRLVIASRSVAPDFKILMFPHRKGDSLPVTTWNADRTKLTIENDGVKDEISFAKGPDGRTRVQVTRAGEAIGLP